jgi:hypothetical protein
VIELLARVLTAAGSDLTADDLADVLWLLAARHDNPSQRAQDHDHVVDETDTDTTATDPPKPRSPIPPARQPTIPPTRAPASPVYLDHVQTDGRPVAANRVEIRRRSTIGHPLELARALRPFTRVREPGRPLLDVDASVEATAEARHLVIESRPEPCRRLDVALVIDDSSSVALFRDATLEFEKSLAQVGAFRSVSRWELAAATPRDRIRSQLLLRDAKGAPQTADHLIDPSGRRLVLLITDFVGDHWYDHRYWAALQRWAATMPTSVLHTLPERYWTDTALGEQLVATRAPRPASPNSQLDVSTPWWAVDDDRAEGLPVPVSSLSPAAISTWAAAVVGGIGWIPATLTVSRAHAPGVANARVNARDRVLAFRSRASRDAQRLAEVLALAP